MSDQSGLRFMPDAQSSNALAEAWDDLLALDRAPAPLHEHLAQGAHWKVGLYFESLLTWWLRRHSRYTLLAHNLQIRDEVRTLGAFDYLVRDSSGQAQHWEVAVKFYLQRQPSTEWSAWVGPGRRDRLDIKLARMRDHQLPLSSRPEAAEALASFGLAQPLDQLAMLKGMLFAPWGGTERRPVGGAQAVSLGQWVTVSEVASFAARHMDQRWCLREKPDWLGPARRSRARSLATSAWVEQARETGAAAPQMWSSLRELDGGVWFEDQRVFVVPDDWPASPIR